MRLAKICKSHVMMSNFGPAGVLSMGMAPVQPTLEMFYGAAEDRSKRNYMQVLFCHLLRSVLRASPIRSTYSYLSVTCMACRFR